MRYFNVFGKRQDPNGAYAAVIPKWISALVKGEDVFINGDGNTSRDFSYINNIIQANILAAFYGQELNTSNRGNFPSIFNIAVGGNTTLNELYQLLCLNLSKSLPDFQVRDPIYRDFRKGDVLHSQADISRARKHLGYEPSHGIEEGLKDTLAWYVSSTKR